MGDEMSKDLITATVEETTVSKDYEFAVDAINASKSKPQRIGMLTVSIVQMKKTDKGFLSQLHPQGVGDGMSKDLTTATVE